MSNSLGTGFYIINDVVQLLDPEKYGGGPWVHLATVRRGLHEYIAFRHLHTNQSYVERFDPTSLRPFKKIEDDDEFNELVEFLKEKGVFDMAGHTKVGKYGLPGFNMKDTNGS